MTGWHDLDIGVLPTSGWTMLPACNIWEATIRCTICEYDRICTIPPGSIQNVARDQRSLTKAKGSHDAWDRRWISKNKMQQQTSTNQIFNTYLCVCMAFPPKHTKTYQNRCQNHINIRRFFWSPKSRGSCLFQHLSSAVSWCLMSAAEVLGPFEYLSQHLLANSGDLCSKPGPIWGKSNIHCGI